MSYLHHATKHASSSYGLSNKKKSISTLFIVALVIILIICYFIFGGLIGDILFGIKNMFAPSAYDSIALRSSAYDARMAALEVENNSLKRLLIKTGVRLPTDIGNNGYASIYGNENNARAILGMNASSTLPSTSSSTDNTGDDTQPKPINISDNGTSEDAFDKENQAQKQAPNQNRLTLQNGDTIASVLMRPPQSPYDSLIINVGTESGITQGDRVYAFTGFPIGEIVEVKRDRSTVRLLSTPGSKIEVLIGTTTLAVTAEGKGAGNFFLKLPKVTEIKVGDAVVRNYLPPEVLGTIESVDSQDGEAYIYAYFKLPIQLNSLIYVLIKKNPSQL